MWAAKPLAACGPGPAAGHGPKVMKSQFPEPGSRSGKHILRCELLQQGLLQYTRSPGSAKTHLVVVLLSTNCADQQ